MNPCYSMKNSGRTKRRGRGHRPLFNISRLTTLTVPPPSQGCTSIFSFFSTTATAHARAGRQSSRAIAVRTRQESAARGRDSRAVSTETGRDPWSLTVDLPSYPYLGELQGVSIERLLAGRHDPRSPEGILIEATKRGAHKRGGGARSSPGESLSATSNRLCSGTERTAGRGLETKFSFEYLCSSYFNPLTFDRFYSVHYGLVNSR